MLAGLFRTQPAVKDITGGRGADVVFDFVGVNPTGDLAMRSVGVAGAVDVIGAGGGSAKVGLLTAPYDVEVSISLWGRRRELLELVAMAHRGQVAIETTTYSLADGPRAYQDLHDGKIRGRAVVVP